MLPKVVKPAGAHELFMVMYVGSGIIGERSERDTIRGVQI